MFLNIFNLSLNPGSQYFVLIDPIVSSIIFTSFVIILLLLIKAPSFTIAEHIILSNGLYIQERKIFSLNVKAIIIANLSLPLAKFVVPSIGSTVQQYASSL